MHAIYPSVGEAFRYHTDADQLEIRTALGISARHVPDRLPPREWLEVVRQRRLRRHPGTPHQDRDGDEGDDQAPGFPRGGGRRHQSIAAAMMAPTPRCTAEVIHTVRGVGYTVRRP